MYVYLSDSPRGSTRHPTPNFADPVTAGAVSGVQGSLQSAFQTLSYAVGIAVPRAEDFSWLMAGSCCVVAAAAALYTSSFLRYNVYQPWLHLRTDYTALTRFT